MSNIPPFRLPQLRKICILYSRRYMHSAPLSLPLPRVAPQWLARGLSHVEFFVCLTRATGACYRASRAVLAAAIASLWSVKGAILIFSDFSFPKISATILSRLRASVNPISQSGQYLSDEERKIAPRQRELRVLSRCPICKGVKLRGVDPIVL